MGVDPEEDKPRLLEVSEGLATITIKGPLVNSDSPLLEMFGVTGYPEIREAILAAAKDPEVSQILLDIDSGGGQVSGVSDTAKLIRLVNDKVKPVSTYTDTMASAAYWLGCSAGSVYAGRASMVGSIGVIATFAEFSKANEMEGRTVTVIRAGKYKALANVNEPLTQEGRAQIQALVDSSYGVFIEHVAEMRGVTYAIADKVMGDGQEFIGKASLDVGLIDGITNFDALVSDLKQKIVATSQKTRDNAGNDKFRLSGCNTTKILGGIMAKKALTEADIAALAAGAILSSNSSSSSQATNLESLVEPVTQAASNLKTGVPNGLQTLQGRLETPEEVKDVQPLAADFVSESKVEVLAIDSAREEELANQRATVQVLVAQLAAKDALILESAVRNSKVEDRLAENQTVSGPLLEIAAQSLSNMQIAMGGQAFIASGLGAVQVLAEHERVSNQFKNKFKVGGIAAVTGDATPEKTQIDPRHQARVNAVRFHK
jgi:signal peptide peptidase SppA